MDKGAICRIKTSEWLGGFYSTYSVVPKRDGGFRLILDLRNLNGYLKVLRFHMLSPARGLQVVSRNQWFVTLDLREACFHVTVHPVHWQYLRFAFEGRAYEFMVLPFGLSLAPRTFTKCMDAVLASLTYRGLLILNYLDDWLICAPTRTQVLSDRRHAPDPHRRAGHYCK